MSQCCVCMEATGEKSVVRVALVHRGRGPAGRGPPSPHPRLGQAVGPLGARDGETRTRRPPTTRPSPVPSSSGAHQLRPRVPPVLRAPMVPAQGDGLPRTRPAPSARRRTTWVRRSPFTSTSLVAPRRTRRPPPARASRPAAAACVSPRVPLRSRRHDRRRQPRRRRDVRADLRSRRPERARGPSPPSEVASRCVALGERVAALREETRALAAEANDARRRAREAEDAAAAAELAATTPTRCARNSPGRNTSCTWRYTSATPPPSPNERARPRLCARRRSSASGRTSCSASAERSRRSRRSVNSSATSPRAASSARRISSVGAVARSRRRPETRGGDALSQPRREKQTIAPASGGVQQAATRLREKERALAAAEVAATAAGGESRRGSQEGEGEGTVRVRRYRRSRGFARRTRRARWSRDDDDAWNPEDASLFPRARTKTTKRARDATRISPTSRTSPSRRREETPSRWRGSRRGGAREGRSVAPRPRVETDPDSGSGPGRFVRDRRRTEAARRTRGKIFWTTSSRKSTRRRTRRRARTTRPPPPLTRTARPRPPLDRLRFGCRPGRRRSRGAASEAASGTTRARVRIPRGTRDGKSSFTAQTVAAVAQRWFDRAGRASSRGAPLCDARDDARRAERTRVD